MFDCPFICPESQYASALATVRWRLGNYVSDVGGQEWGPNFLRLSEAALWVNTDSIGGPDREKNAPTSTIPLMKMHNWKQPSSFSTLKKTPLIEQRNIDSKIRA